MTCLPSSTATPSPAGEDSAASSASRSVPSGRKSEPPAMVLSYNEFPCLCNPTPFTSIHAYGEPSGLVTKAQSPGPRSRESTPVLGDRADVVQRKARRLEELQAAVTAIGADETGHEVVRRVGQQPPRGVVLLRARRHDRRPRPCHRA